MPFWGGSGFYERFKLDPNDYFWLDTSGYGAGVYNIDVGVGKLALAYFGGLNDTLISHTSGSFYKHTLDVRLKDISLGGLGSLMLVGVANYEKGTTFQTGYDSEGNTFNLANPLRVGGAWGVGGGIVYKLSLSDNRYIQLYALFGRGAANFTTATDLGTAHGVETTLLPRSP